MENFWVQSKADKFVENYGKQGVSGDIALRVYSSRLLGAVPELVLHGGGNVSVKTLEPNLFGDLEEVLCVKGSGWNMESIEPDGLPSVRLKPLRDSVKLESLTDFDMVNLHRTSLMNSGAPNPSVETLLHAFLPHKYVDHTHANAVLALTDQPDGAEICREVFGDRVALVPYVMPGFQLAKSASQIFQENTDCEGLILLKHGIFTFGETAEVSYRRMIDLVTLAESRIPHVTVVNREVSSELGVISDLAPIIRGKCVLSGVAGDVLPFISTFRTSEAIRSYSMAEEVARWVMAGPVTPDHVIRTKPWPLLIEAPGVDGLSAWKDDFGKDLTAYQKLYEGYFNRNNGKQESKRTPLDSLPRVVLVKGLGLFAFGTDLKAANVVADLAETNIAVVRHAEEIGKFQSIGETDIFDIEYWPLEQAKLSGSRRANLSGRVVVVTGGAGAIGKATANAFKAEGAEVVLLDMSEARLRQVTRDIGGHAFCCDVADQDEVKSTFREICELCGGIDILVSNAGFASQGRIGEVSDEALRSSFDVNFFAHQNVASVAAKIMVSQGIGGVLLFNVSKQAVNPGPDFGPYGLPKSATMFLSRQYAVDYGRDGIRSNAVNADRVRSGIMTTEMISSRAQSRGLEPGQYMSSNLLGKEVLAEDVAKAFVDLALSPRTTGAVLTVDGGNIAAALR
jgi:rhamnose utilization protein RhaD (predicted bifunctional aldolase and dehydrogenase)/NAD(P)-dependent dehydrogenase (short-subunit alcohol dehydrogenase family)